MGPPGLDQVREPKGSMVFLSSRGFCWGCSGLASMSVHAPLSCGPVNATLRSKGQM